MKNTDTKDTLLKIGSELMTLKGYNGVGLKEILDAAGIPKGSFYHYFSSKEDFAIHIINLNFKVKHDFFKLILKDNKTTPKTRLKNLFNAYKEIAFGNDCLLVKMNNEMANLSDSIKQSLITGMGLSKKILIECLNESKKIGEIGSEHDVEKLCEFIFSGWEGALIRSRLVGNGTPFDAFFYYIFNWVLH